MEFLSRSVAQTQDQNEDDYRELPCRDFDLDCYAFDGVIPFGGYRRCQSYMPEMGKCIFLSGRKSEGEV